MREAIALARKNFEEGDYAVAALVVQDGKVLAQAGTTITKEQDATCHAEINVIRKASKLLGSKNLTGCYLYTTYEPCPMCTAASIWAKVHGIVYGASREDQTPQAPWRVNIPAAEVIKKGTPALELYPEFMREECKQLLNLRR